MEKSKDQKLAGAFVVTGDWKYEIKQTTENYSRFNAQGSKLGSVKAVEDSKRAKIREEGCHHA